MAANEPAKDKDVIELPAQPRAAQQFQAPAPAGPAPVPKKRAARKKGGRAKEKSVVVKSKRKNANARAYLRAGKGRIRINKRNLDALSISEQARGLMLEPLTVSEQAREAAGKVDIQVNVHGGGVMAQAQAIRGVIAKGIVAYSGSESLKKELMGYDRSMLVDDPRRVEPKKFKGPKARARFQTSYR